MSRSLAVVCAAVLFTPLSVAAQPVTALRFDSQLGDFIGRGQDRTWTDSDLQFTVPVSSPSSIRIHADNFSAPGSDSIWWDVSFRAPNGSVLVPGVYEQARRDPFAGDQLPGLSVSGDGRSCNWLVGRFQIYEIEFDSAGQLIRLAADFEQHCEDSVPALFGAVRFNAVRTSLMPFDGLYPVYSLTITPSEYGFVSGPGIDCGAARTDCAEVFSTDTSIALTATPLAGYVFLGWSTPDCIGAQIATTRVFRQRFCAALFDRDPAGIAVTGPDYSQSSFYLDHQQSAGARTRRVYIHPLAKISVTASSPQELRFRIEDHWDESDRSIRFKAPFGEVLSPGAYNYAAGTSSWSGGAAAIEFSGCSSGGRYQIYDASFSGSTVTSFAADFELYCFSATERITGSIRYSSSTQALLPFDGAYPSYSLEVVATVGGRVLAGGAFDCGDEGAGDCHETYAAAETVALEAVSSPGYSFMAWGGACRGGGASTTVFVDRTLRCFAVFSPAPGSDAQGDQRNGVATLLVLAPGATSGDQASVWLWPDVEVSVSRFETSDFLSFAFRSTDRNSHGVEFGSRSGPLVPGDYEEALGHSNEFFPTLNVIGCSLIEGRFRIYEVVFDTAGTLVSFAADFEARCTNLARPHVVGAVRFNASRRTLIPFDGAYPIHKIKILPAFNGLVSGTGVACGLGTSVDCDETFSAAQTVSLTATPAAGYRFVGWGGACAGAESTTVLVDAGVRRCYAVFNSAIPGIRPEDPRLGQLSLFIDGDPGGPALDSGAGIRRIWIDLEISASGFSRNSTQLFIRHQDGFLSWIGFGAPGTTNLAPGIYEGATSSSRGSDSPWISLSGPLFRSCSPGPFVGRFVVHEIAFDGPFGSIPVSFAADFEVRCANAAPAMRGSIRLRSSRNTVVPFAALITPVYRPPDFSGDGSPDLVWRNAMTGRNAFWFMNGDAMATTPPFSAGADLVADLDWEIRAVADMNGDRRGDVIWQHATNGKLAAWFFVGATRVATPLFITLSGSPTESDLDWKIVGAADMNADGHSDVLWRHRVSGALRIWHMRGMEQLESIDIVPAVTDPLWQVAGIADMNGDGWADVVWRHYGSGRLAVWFMIDSYVLSTMVLPVSVSDTQWRLAGVADINRDGHADFVWQHLTGGKLAVWLMHGLNPVHYGMITPAVISDPNWRIVGVR